MECTIVSLEAKQATNGNWYVNIIAQPANDPFAEELKYRMWCSEQLAAKLANKTPETIELEKVRVEVEPFQRVNEDSVVSPKVCTTLTVVCRQFKGERVDDAVAMANKLRRQLLEDGKLVNVAVDDFDGATGDIPE